MRDFFAGLLALILVVAILIALSFFSLGMYQYFAPKWENARREVFENTQSYQLGKEQEQRKLQREADRNSENAEILENIMDHQRP